MKHLKSLNLSLQQKQQLSQMRTEMRSKTAPIKSQLQVRRSELRALWLAKSPSRSAIVAKHNELDVLRRQLRDARIDFRLRVLKMLTPQQRAKLQADLAARPPRGKARGKGRGKGWRRGGGWAGQGWPELNP
jgi:Spy/CpxP family protein refolding chaperone